MTVHKENGKVFDLVTPELLKVGGKMTHKEATARLLNKDLPDKSSSN